MKPLADISATEKEYTISLEVPGVDEKDIRIEVADNTLDNSGREKEERNKNYYRMERSYGTFRRVLSLPEDADQDTITAHFSRRILTLTIKRADLPAGTSGRSKL